MKEKKRLIVLIFMLTLLIPLFANAENCESSTIEIQSIVLDKTEGKTIEKSKPIIKDNKIELDLKFFNVGDNAEYTIKLRNNSNETYYLDKDDIIINNEYIDYKIENSDNKITPGVNKEYKLKVIYNKEVTENYITDGSYYDTNSLVLKLQNKVSRTPLDILKNPQTTSIFFMLILLSSSIILSLILINKRKTSPISYITILLLLILPITTLALCSYNIDIETKIEIEKKIDDPIVYIDHELLLRKSGKLAKYDIEQLSEEDYIEATPKNLKEEIIANNVKYVDKYVYLTDENKLYDIKSNKLISSNIKSTLRNDNNDMEGFYTGNKGVYIAYNGLYIDSNVDKVILSYGDFLSYTDKFIITLENEKVMFRSNYFSIEAEKILETHHGLLRMTNNDLVYLGGWSKYPMILKGGGKIISSSESWVIDKNGKLYSSNLQNPQSAGEEIYPEGIYPIVDNKFKSDVIISNNGHDVWFAGRSGAGYGYANKRWSSSDDKAIKVVGHQDTYEYSYHFVTASNQLWTIEWNRAVKEYDDYSLVANEYDEIENIINKEDNNSKIFIYEEILNNINNNSLNMRGEEIDYRKEKEVKTLADIIIKDDEKQYIKRVPEPQE